jgi:hypothetical protein
MAKLDAIQLKFFDEFEPHKLSFSFCFPISFNFTKDANELESKGSFVMLSNLHIQVITFLSCVVCSMQ